MKIIRRNIRERSYMYKSPNAVNGKKRTRLYNIWRGMCRRCELPDHSSYARYGAKGISVCDEWHDFDAFIEWAVSSGYDDNLTLYRKDRMGNYSPQNCSWVSVKVQNNHRSNNRVITYNGESKTVSEWSDCNELGLTSKQIHKRLDAGWDIERALTTPILQRSKTSDMESQ